MFRITEGDFKNQKYGDESYLSNWPMLYILENGKQVYIGESNHVKNRMSQHHSSVDKRIFDKEAFFLMSDESRILVLIRQVLGTSYYRRNHDPLRRLPYQKDQYPVLSPQT